MTTKQNPAESHAKAGTHARIENKSRRGSKPKGQRAHGGAVEGRIAHIETMMHELTFITGKTVKQLSAQWKLRKNTVAEYAAEASRRVRASVIDDKDHVSATVGQALETALRSAIAEKQWRSVAQLADTWAKISGASAATRTEVSGPNGAPLLELMKAADFGSFTDQQIDRLRGGDATPLTGDGGDGVPPAPAGRGGSADKG